MFPEAPKKLVDWSIVVAAIIAFLALFITPKQTTKYIPQFLHQGVPVWELIVFVVLLILCYSLYRRLMKRPGGPCPGNAPLSTGKVVQYGSKVALLTFDHRFVQVDMDDSEKRLKVTDRDKPDKEEEFSLNDPDNDASTRQLKYGDKISLIGLGYRFMAADLNDNGKQFVYSNRQDYRTNNWGKFTVEPLSPKTKLKTGDDVLYGHPIALKAVNGNYLAFREDQSDQLLWVAAKEVKAWEQFTFVTLP
jgi:hypothetical protein